MIDVGIGLGIAFAVLAGTASVLQKRGLAHSDAKHLLVVTLLVGTPVFLVAIAITRPPFQTSSSGLGYALAGGVVGGLFGRASIHYSIQHVGPGKTLGINAISPFVVVLLSALFLDEAISSFILVGTVAIVIGVFGLARDSVAEVVSADDDLSVLLYPASSVLFVSLAVLLRKLAMSNGVDPVLVGAIDVLTALAIVSPVIGLSDSVDLASIDRRSVLYFAAGGVLMALAFLSYFVGLSRTPAVVFFPIIQTRPLVSLALTAFVFRELEIVRPSTMLSALVLVVGVVFVVVPT